MSHDSTNTPKRSAGDMFPTPDLRRSLKGAADFTKINRAGSNTLGLAAAGVFAGTMLADGQSELGKIARISSATVAAVCALASAHYFVKMFFDSEEFLKGNRFVPDEVKLDAATKINTENARHDGVIHEIYRAIDDYRPPVA